AETLHKLGVLQGMIGHLDESERSFRQALEIQRQLVAEKPETAASQLSLAQTETSLANQLAMVCRFPEAERLYNAACARQEKLAAATMNVPIHQLGLARSIQARGRLFQVLDRESEY